MSGTENAFRFLTPFVSAAVEVLVVREGFGKVSRFDQPVDQRATQLPPRGGELHAALQPLARTRVAADRRVNLCHARDRIQVVGMLREPRLVVRGQSRPILRPQIDRLDPPPDFAIDPVIGGVAGAGAASRCPGLSNRL